ncbi:hypothetical protein VXN63_09740 [Marinilactibacillus sp. XAAS-LB27]|uniref:hypothetical protein n=1 Tax=Marinilactibacillus sp. XAAS-LB27 TaxID=3114538 RepID=UPI002E173EC6|nr:hypothetical protein [Marinilactibacillus sp. XAAS-LB27]
MNRKISLLSRSVSIILNVFMGLILFQIVYFMYFVFSDTSFELDTQLPNGIMTILSFGRQSGEIDQTLVGTLNIIVSFSLLFTTLIGYFIVSKLFSDMAKSEVPFKNFQVKKIYILSILSLICFLILTVLPNILYAVFLEGTYVQVNVDGGLLLLSIIFYTLAEIFKYGESLQKDVDETL